MFSSTRLIRNILSISDIIIKIREYRQKGKENNRYKDGLDYLWLYCYKTFPKQRRGITYKYNYQNSVTSEGHMSVILMCKITCTSLYVRQNATIYIETHASAIGIHLKERRKNRILITLFPVLMEWT